MAANQGFEGRKNIPNILNRINSVPKSNRKRPKFKILKRWVPKTDPEKFDTGIGLTYGFVW